MSESALIYPESPDEYFTYGWYVNPNHIGHWVFGLPAAPGLSSNTCGALPFRNGTGLCSPYCLRGEDWVFMAEWAHDRYSLLNGLAIIPALSVSGPYDVIDAGPTFSQLSSMYMNLNELRTVYGSDCIVPDQEIQQGQHDTIYEAVSEVFMNCLSVVSMQSQQPSLSVNQPLQLSRIQTFFSDMSQMKCTFGSARHDGNSLMDKDLYYYYKDDGQPATEREWFIEDMRIANVNYNGNRPVQFYAQFIGLFSGHEVLYDAYGHAISNKFSYALMNLGGKRIITQDLGAEYPFQIACHYGGASLAEDAADLLGMNKNPMPQQDGSASFTMELHYLYVVVWPNYLQL